MKELISIIIPVYNVEFYIEKCILTAINQTYSNIEILLVDDGSTDSSGLICDNYANIDHRVKVIHKQNGGLSDARNCGIKESVGKYIFFMDSDDWISNDCIEILYDYLCINDLDISCGGICLAYPNGDQRYDCFYGSAVFSNKEASFDIHIGNKIKTVAWNKLISKCLFENIIFPQGKVNEDEFVTYKLIEKSDKIGFVDKPTYFYFQRNDSIMHSFDTSIQIDAIQALIERIDFYHSIRWESLIGCVQYVLLRLIYRNQKQGAKINYHSYFLKYISPKFIFVRSMLPFSKRIKAILMELIILTKLIINIFMYDE